LQKFLNFVCWSADACWRYFAPSLALLQDHYEAKMLNGTFTNCVYNRGNQLVEEGDAPSRRLR
jgi:hypothetical protein